MQFIASLLTNLPYLNPIPLAGWLVWFGFAGLLGLALYGWRNYQVEWTGRTWGIFVALLVTAIFGALFFGLKFSTPMLPRPGLPEEPPGSRLMLFSAIPWILAGGWLGPIAAAALGMVSGLLRGVWDTHNFFTLLDFGLMAALFSVFARQRYRTPFYRLMRQPSWAR
ncbi:MAG: hypothetical protein IPP66_04475 [Anaerolineales bacterium]|nr:hypothetical protein [Anaerolineales bacterium]